MVETATKISLNGDQLNCIGSEETSVKNSQDHYNPSVKLLQIPKTEIGSCGFHLSRSKWDPYPWVSAIDADTPAEITGLKAGDCILEVNGEDILGLRITEVAELVKNKPDCVTLLLWSLGRDPSCDPESLCCGPMPLNLERFSACMKTILSSLECPVCLDTIPPPAIQCQNGHLLCAKCGVRSEKCPVCRERYSPGRSLIAEQIYNTVTDAFNLRECPNNKLRDKLFGAKCKRSPVTIGNLQKHNNVIGTGIDINKVSVQSPTNKFLAKILGKASSLDNLTCKKDVNRLGDCGGNGINNVYMISGKPLSLSTNDLTNNNKIKGKNAIAIPRCPSVNRLNPEGCFNGLLLSKRPSTQSVTINTSTECIADGLSGSEKSLTIVVPRRTEERFFYCPHSCEKKFNVTSLQQHVKVHHNIPIVSFSSSGTEIALPPKAPIEDASLILVLDYKQFWLKLRVDDDGSIFTSALLQGSEDECFQYMIEVRLKNRMEDRLLEKELIMRSIVYSLTNTSWNDVLNRQLGVFYNQNILSTTFPDGSELLLRVDIKHREEE